MKQCELSQGDRRAVLWIDNRGAKIGASVELIGQGFWRVDRVYQHDIEPADLRRKQSMDRNALPSIAA